MARIFQYERSIDAVLTNVNVENNSYLVKEEPLDPDDSDPNCLSFNVNTTVQSESAEPDNDLNLNSANNKETPPPKPVESENSKSNLGKRKRKRSSCSVSESQDSRSSRGKKAHLDIRDRERKGKSANKTRCPVCFLKMRSEKSLKAHIFIYRTIITCDICNALFSSFSTLRLHRWSHSIKASSRRKRIRNRKYSCNFCSRQFKVKTFLQAHLFHIHGNAEFPLEPNLVEAGQNVSTEATDNHILNNVDKTVQDKSAESTVQDELTRNKTRHVENSNKTEEQLKGSDTPGRKSRQTTLVEFPSFSPRNSRKGLDASKEVAVAELTSVTSNHDAATRTPNDGSTEMAKVARTSTPVTSTSTASIGDKPFVQIHVTPNMLMSLRNQKLKAEAENCLSPITTTIATATQNASYNLRRTIQDSNRESLRQQDTNSPDAGGPSRRTRSNDTPKQSQKDKLIAKIKRNTCVIRLERCDKILSLAHSRIDERRSISRRAFFEKVARNAESNEEGEETKAASNAIPKHTNVVTVAEFEKAAVDKLKQQSGTTKDTVENDENKAFSDKISKNSFTSETNEVEQADSFSTVYMSSVCNARYTSARMLLQHYLRQHQVFMTNKCCVCTERIDDSATLKRHLALHCIKVTRSKDDTVSINDEMNCNASRKRQSCKICHKQFYLKWRLKKHQTICRRMNTLRNGQSKSCAESSASNEKAQEQEQAQEQGYTDNLEFCAQDIRSTLKQCPTNKQTSDNKGAAIAKVPAYNSISSTLQPRAVTGNERLINGDAIEKDYQGYVNGANEEKFSCTICGKRFKRFQNLGIHERTYCKPPTNQCNICNTSVTTKKLLQLHMIATHTSSCTKYTYFCKFCNQGFYRKPSVQVHERHFHISQLFKARLNIDCDSNVSAVCKVCNLMFESYQCFIEHNMYYYQGQSFTCKFCDKSFQGMYRFYRHNKLVHCPKHTRRSYVYTCDVCNEGFDNETHYHAHKLHVHFQKTDMLLHTMQDHTYALTASKLVLQVGRRQMLATTYSCNVCTLKFTNQTDLSNHEMEYSIDGEFQCHKCPRRCRTAVVLAKHQSLNHAGSDLRNSYKCRHCGEVLITSTSVLCHLKHFHSGNVVVGNNVDRPCRLDRDQQARRSSCRSSDKGNGKIDYTCLTCDIKVENEIKLKNHLLEYSDIGSYSCTICQRKFVELYFLEMHKLNHSKLYIDRCQYRCPICMEGFSSVINVRMHVLHLHRYETFAFNNTTAQPNVNGSFNVRTATEDEDSTRVFSASLIDATRTLNVRDPSPVNKTQKQTTVKCSQCNITFSSVKNLTKHISRYLNSGHLKCTHCERKFSWQTLLIQHMRKHLSHKIQFLKYKCIFCVERFRNTVTLYAHVIHVHGKEKLSQAIEWIRSDGNYVNADNHPVSSIGSATELSNTRAEGAANVDTSTAVDDEDAEEPNAEQRAQSPMTKVDVTRQNQEVSNISEGSQCYAFPICKSEYPSLKRFQERFKLTHTVILSQIKMTQSVDANVNRCSICKRAFAEEQELKEHTKKLHRGIDPIAAKRSAPVTETNDIDDVKVVWENCPSRVRDPEDSNVQGGSVIKGLDNSSAGNVARAATSDVGKLKVKSFARIQMSFPP